MKRFRDGCASTSRKSTSRLSKFARLQLCLFFCCTQIETISAKSSLRRKARQKFAEIYMNEPTYEQQSWIFEAIKMRPAWNMGYTGENIGVRINDENWGDHHTAWIGEGRLIESKNSTKYDFSCGDPFNQLESEKTKIANDAKTLTNHGAAVASVLGADGTDGFCGVGIAPRSKLSFCNFKEGISNATVLIHDVKSEKSFDISINAFAYSGCSSESGREIKGVYLPKVPNERSTEEPKNRNNDTQSTDEPKNGNDNNQPTDEPSNQNDTLRLLESPGRILEDCPFQEVSKDPLIMSSDAPCQVCTKEEFDFVYSFNNRDNVFETERLSSSNKGDKTFSEAMGYRENVSHGCASSVREYCLHNFRWDEATCTEWIEVINHGTTCSFKSNVGKEIHQSLKTGVKEGRNGLGVVYIFSSGDSYGNGDNVNYQAFPKSRFGMTVGAIKMISQSGTFLKPIHSTYSTGGSSIFVVAPGGDYDSAHSHIGAGGDFACDEIGYGTAFAAPVVGGVVALMLEAYQNATWRDVRAIIAETSKPVEMLDSQGKNDDATFGVNAAGFGYSDLYGFGMIHAWWCVQKAKNWNRKQKHAPPEISITERSGEVNLDINDDSFSTTTSTIMLYSDAVAASSSYVESVSVYLKLRYFNRGHLKITLRSPSGTTSVLSPGGRNEYGQLNCGEWWEFLTLRSWGENPNGSWKLSITDTKGGSGDAKCIDRPGFLVPTSATDFTLAMTCDDYESQGLCFDGKRQKLPDEDLHYILFEQEHGAECGMNATSACCACGGGIKPDDKEVLYGQLMEWKIVLGDGSPKYGNESVNFYDAGFGDNEMYEPNTKESKDKVTVTKKLFTFSPTPSPTKGAPTLPPTFKKIEILDFEDTEVTSDNVEGVFNGIKDFFSNMFGYGDDESSDGEGEAGEVEPSKASSVVAWIITFGFSIMLLLRGSSLCDFHLNFQRDEPRRRSRRSRSNRR